MIEATVTSPTKRLRFLTRKNVGGGFTAPLDKVSEVTFLPMEAIGERGELDLSTTRPGDEVQSGYSRFSDGDVVIAKITPCFENGKGALIRGTSTGIGFGTTELHILIPGPQLDGRFLYYVTVEPRFRRLGEACMTGAAGQQRVPEDFVRDFRIPVFPLPRQRAVAGYLDRETARIDALIATKQRVLGLLAEKRRALITRAVACGLDHNAALHDSGIPWLGEIPAHWELKRLKHISPFITVGVVVNPSTYVTLDGVPFLYGSDVTEEGISLDSVRRIPPEVSRGQLAKTCLKGDDVVTVRVGAPGISAVVPPELDGANCASIMLVRGAASFDSHWLAHAMNSSVGRHQVALVQYGAAQEQFNISHAVDFLFAVPPLAEQRQIAMYIDDGTTALRGLHSATTRTIDLLKERRAALIAAAVTGQIAVPLFSGPVDPVAKETSC